jgi:hypothetical protein
MKKLAVTLLIAALVIPVVSLARAFHERARAEDEVREVVLSCYIHGAFNELNPKAMRKGFHPDFAIFSAKGEEIERYPIKVWAENTAKTKASPDFDPKQNKWDHNFDILDVTGGAASAKIELSKDGKLIYTDYLSLLKFDSGWRIVAKVYHRHN